VSLRYLLDTDTISCALRGQGGVAARLAAERPSQLGISAISVAELRYGVARRSSRRLAHLVDELTRAIPVLPFGPEEAVAYGRLAALLEARGTPIGQLDTMIAAHALARSVTLVTRNGKHFGRVPGLALEDWFQAEG